AIGELAHATSATTASRGVRHMAGSSLGVERVGASIHRAIATRWWFGSVAPTFLGLWVHPRDAVPRRVPDRGGYSGTSEKTYSSSAGSTAPSAPCVETRKLAVEGSPASVKSRGPASPW